RSRGRETRSGLTWRRRRARCAAARGSTAAADVAGARESGVRTRALRGDGAEAEAARVRRLDAHVQPRRAPPVVTHARIGGQGRVCHRSVPGSGIFTDVVRTWGCVALAHLAETDGVLSMANHLAYDVLSRLVEQRAPLDEQLLAERHIARCARCRSEREWLER